MEPRVSGVPCWWDFKPPFLSFPSCLLFCISQKESSVLFPFGSVEFPLVGLFEINKPDLLPLKHLSAAFLDANITGHRLSWMLRCRAQTEIKEDCGQIKRPESRLKTDGDSIRKRRRIISPSLSPSVGVWPSKYLSKQLRHRKLVIFIFLCFHTHTRSVLVVCDDRPVKIICTGICKKPLQLPFQASAPLAISAKRLAMKRCCYDMRIAAVR